GLRHDAGRTRAPVVRGSLRRYLPAELVSLGHGPLDSLRGALRGRAPPRRLARAGGADRTRLRAPDRDLRASAQGAALRVPHARDSPARAARVRADVSPR